MGIAILTLESHKKFPQTLNWYWIFAISPAHTCKYLKDMIALDLSQKGLYLKQCPLKACLPQSRWS